eukprot:CAMPEP_0114364042 /NCGR_PEP_ID=MMETSP0101-20121206/27164_1 /TAXON_ID=38822 ORGANISM="Pteridomonas danica, Strain PT" /NCGR_SAMPLE_ID=MMETSP0101 /ASSEMBLY_ACC=CAM_ASM_000211 /LENGTH=35 /DNA_ID= /DNA_START= /DNA_END= /DNA_ORIENTATION=
MAMVENTASKHSTMRDKHGKVKKLIKSAIASALAS